MLVKQSIAFGTTIRKNGTSANCSSLRVISHIISAIFLGLQLVDAIFFQCQLEVRTIRLTPDLLLKRIFISEGCSRLHCRQVVLVGINAQFRLFEGAINRLGDFGGGRLLAAEAFL